MSVVYTATLIIVWLAGLKNQKLSFSQAFNASKTYLLRIFVASLLVGLASIASFLLFIVPFFFIFPRLIFTPFLVVDKNMGAIDAFSASWSMSKGHMGKIYGVIGASLLMLLLAATIIGIPFSIYFLFMYSAAFAILYTHINTTQPAGVPAGTPAAPVANTPAPQTPAPAAPNTAGTPAQVTPTEPPAAPQV